jgi:uncharacterized membrane protein SirB2
VWNTVQPIVDWLGSSALGQWLGQSAARIAGLFVVHLVGLTLLLGGTVVISLRLLGLGFRSGSVAGLAREIAPWRLAGLALMLVSGALIFTGGAVSYFEGVWFRRKMTLLVIALVFNFTVFRTVTTAQEGQFSARQNCITAGIALLLWFGVAVAGRSIAFF